MKKTYINPQVSITRLQYVEPLLAFSDNNKSGESIESGGEGSGTPDGDGIYWGNARGTNVWGGWED